MSMKHLVLVGLFALLAACLWAGYIILGARMATSGAGVDGLGVGMLVGALAIAPLTVWGLAGLTAVIATTPSRIHVAVADQPIGASAKVGRGQYQVAGDVQHVILRAFYSDAPVVVHFPDHSRVLNWPEACAGKRWQEWRADDVGWSVAGPILAVLAWLSDCRRFWF